MEWCGLMNNIESCTAEVVNNEIIFAWHESTRGEAAFQQLRPWSLFFIRFWDLLYTVLFGFEQYQ